MIIKKHKFRRSINLKINQLIELDNWHGPVALLCDFLIIGFGVYLSLINFYFYPVTTLLIASRQGALSNLAHEAAHNRLTKSKKLNYFLGTYLSGYLILQEFYAYSHTHIKNHHLKFGKPGADPDYTHHIDAGLYNTKNHSFFIKEYIIKPFLLGNMYQYIKHIISSRGPKYFYNKKHSIVMALYLLVLCLFFLYFKIFHYFFIFWIVPLFTVFPIIGWFIDISEHFPLMRNTTDLYMTRNRFGNFFENIIFNIHNENYHLVHHLKPSVPFWNLKKAHRILMEDPDYCEVNSNMGGIFFSYKKKKSLLSKLIRKDSFQILVMGGKNAC